VSHFVRSRRSYLATTRYLLLLFTATYVCPILSGVGEAIWRLLVILLELLGYILLSTTTIYYYMCVPFCQESAKLLVIYYYYLLLHVCPVFVRSRRSYLATTRYPPCTATATATPTSAQSQGTIFLAEKKLFCFFFLRGATTSLFLLASLPPQQQLEPARYPKADVC
jgi:hypothetical protein